MAFYIPAFDEKAKWFGIKEIDHDYYNNPNSLNFSPYVENFSRTKPGTNVIERWENAVKEIENRNGTLVHPRELFPETPNDIFGIKGRGIWYLNNDEEFVYLKEYGPFRILKGFEKSTQYIRFLKVNEKSPKRLLDCQNELEFQETLRDWMRKNKIRFELQGKGV